MKSVLVILGLVAFVGADSCHLPRRLSGEFKMFNYNIGEGKLINIISGMVYIDQEHKRTRIEVNLGEAGKFKIFQLFEERIQYYISNEQCHSVPVQGKIPDITDLTANASIVSRGRIGTGANGLNIVRYAGVTPKVKYITTFTQDDCVPTSSVVVFSVNGVKFIAYSSFTGASLDFDDAVFEIPSECREAHGARARRSVRVEEILGSVKHIFGA